MGYENSLGGAVHAALNICKYLARNGQMAEVIGPYAPTDDVAYLDASERVGRHARIAGDA